MSLFKTSTYVTLMVAATLLLTGCAALGNLGGMFSPAPKPEVGPTGKPVETKPNPPLLERFWSAPGQLYELEAIAGSTFEGINKEKWSQALAGLANLQDAWQQTKPLIGEKKGVKEADEAIEKLSKAINEKKTTEAYESLNKFMGSIGDIGKSYKLSPIADIISVGNSARNVSFYVEGKNWSKAASKVKELEGTWGQVKPSMEQFGILGEMTKTHSTVKQLKDAVNAENKGAVEEHLANLNESMGRIRLFYYGR